MPPEQTATAGRPEPEFWQTLEQWLDDPKFRDALADEFPEDAAEWLDPVSRRRFLTLMGASLALAGAAGCNPSVQPASRRQVVPYVEQPPEVVPNVPLYFATAMPQAGGVGLGLTVRSHEGRPIKIEGNRLHPSSLGATNVYAQGSILGLYDPDRSQKVLHNGIGTTIDRALAALREALEGQRASAGAGVRIVTDPSTSPTLARLMDEFLKRFPKAKWVQYEPAGRDNARKAILAAFGRHANPVYHFDKAKVVLAIDSDFLGASDPADVRYTRDFIAKRKVRSHEHGLQAGDGVRPADMNRLYAVESFVTSTGAKADHRLPLRPTEVDAFVRALAAEFGVAGVTAPALPETAKQWLKPLADDLRKNAKAAAVVVGDAQPPAVHLLALAINEKLGAIGSTLTFTDAVEARPGDPAADFRQLVEEMKGGKVEVLLLWGGNPVYDAPADLDFKAALAGMKGLKVHLGLYRDETAAHSTWHINGTHFLETWGDVRAYDGTVTIQQPLIAPVYGGRSTIELLAALMSLEVGDPLDLVRATWRPHFDGTQKGGDFEAWWQRAVRDGVVPGTALPAATVAAVRTDALAEPAFAAPARAEGLEVQFRTDPTIYDGRYANIAWLQELPKPLTKLTWDNAAIVSPATAARLGCDISFPLRGGENGRSEADVVRLTMADGRSINIAVLILPGHADDCVTLHLGYGRDRAGRVGTPDNAPAGFNTYALRTTGALWTATGAKAEKTGATYFLARPNSYSSTEGRRPVRYATVDEYARDHDFAQVPAVSAGEYKDLRALTPGTPEEWERLFGDARPYPHPAAGGHDRAHKDRPDDPVSRTEDRAAHGEHDRRIIPLSLYPEYPQTVDGQQSSKTYRRWGMAIDLNACTGCGTCVVACQSENNVPVVGKDQVTKGRAMHWLRIDRYFTIPGDRANDDRLGDRYVRGENRAETVKRSGEIKTFFQPLMCVQCEKAPCEVVCPVGATVHSADGLNDMVYNRCVGTRYCSNNCPYKVRRFNFLQFADYTTDSMKLVNNPEVTVRQRGVMEKCTYCIQRIRNAEIEAEREFQTRPKDANGRPKIFDGEVVTACQAACPAAAITFGDLNDAASTVLRWKAEATTYGLLAELNTMPRTSYIAAVRNPNPAMPKGA